MTFGMIAILSQEILKRFNNAYSKTADDKTITRPYVTKWFLYCQPLLR
jgi:hypothetical protein